MDEGWIVILSVISGCSFLAFRIFQVKTAISRNVATVEPAKEFQSFGRIKAVSLQDLARFELLLGEVLPSVEKGQTNISSIQFRVWSNQTRQVLTMRYFMKAYPITAMVLALLTLPIGFIPLVCFIAWMFWSAHTMSKLEGVFASHFNGTLLTLSKGRATNSTGSAEELGKLHGLLRAGVLTEDEFQEAKKRILQKVA